MAKFRSIQPAGSLRVMSAVAFAVLISASASEAHHSYAIYNLQESATIQGTVRAFEWTNPHAMLTVMVPGDDGTETEWWVEMASIGRIARGGWRRDSVKPGDEITIEIHPLKGGGTGGSFLYATLADGRRMGETGTFVNLPAPGGDEEGLRQAEREEALMRSRRAARGESNASLGNERASVRTGAGPFLERVDGGVQATGWNQYISEEFGFSVSLPESPQEGTGSYASRLVPDAVSHHAVVRGEDTDYSAAVVHTGQNDRGMAILGEADFSFSQLGEVVLNSAYRTGEDYGRFIIVDCREDYIALPEGGIDTGDLAREILGRAAGLECPTGSRLTATLLFKSGRLYIISGVASGAAAESGEGPGRFANSVAWAGANSSPMDRAQRGE